MSLAVLHSRALAGMDAPPVTVEVHLANGLPSFQNVGLPEAEVKESKDRVRAALQTARFDFPSRRITVNLAPADLPKESGRFDLPIALGILAASGQVAASQLHQYEFAGELALTGELRPIRGPLLDRIDLQIEVPALRENELSAGANGETSSLIRERVESARQVQMTRQKVPNAQLGPAEIDTFCTPDTAGAELLKQALARLDLSERAYHRILKVARSIADLSGDAQVTAKHIAEAVQYRRLHAGG